MRVAVLHPDLGLGGAERLVVDAAAELAARGHEVVVFTGHHDEARCFAETVGGAGGFEVRVRGKWFPRAVGGRLVAPCAFARGCLLAVAAAREGAWDCALVDQVAPAILPLRLLAPATRVLFYCHFPDLLLSERRGWLKRLYRAPLDLWEEATTGLAHVRLVNSLFTRGVYRETFRALVRAGLGSPEVLYPAVALPEEARLCSVSEAAAATAGADAPVFLSINRFERKKGIGLAVEALALVHARLRRGGSDSRGGGRRRAAAGDLPRLVLAGGYDARLAENVEHLEELKAQARELGVQESVSYFPSFSDTQREELLGRCHAVLYTPQREHFGIVPLEAMAAMRPVVACNSGGPVESVRDGETGFLCEPSGEAFAEAMWRLMDAGLADRMGRAARDHVQSRFSRAAFGDALQKHLKRLVEGRA